MVKIVIVLGAPGSGKGTQCKILAAQNPTWKHISTGDLFRAEIASGSDKGKQLKAILETGTLVPDEVTMAIFESQVNVIISSDQVEVLLLDGCIRTRPQAEFLKEMCLRRSSEFSKPQIVELDVPEEKLVHRLTGRLLNPRTGKIYHMVDNPPKQAGVCDDDGGPLIQRDDDREEVIRKRFQIYRSEKDPILEVLDPENKSLQINGDQAANGVTSALLEAIRI